MKTIRNISLLLALAGRAALAVAQSADQPDKELAPIVVSARRSSTRAQDMALSTTVVDRQDLDIAPGQTLDQVLKNVPGINLTDIPSFAQHPTGQGISMRGLGNARTLVLLDGIPLNDPFYGTVQWSKVPLSSIKRVEVVRGAASSLWGSLAMGGVINIITKLPTRDQTEVTASYGSFNTSTLAIARDVVASDTLQFRLSADNFLTSGYRTMPASQVLGAPNSAYARSVASGSYARNSNAQLAAYFQPSATLSGYLRAGFHELHELSGGQNIAPNHRQNADLALGLTQELGRSSRIEGKFWHQETDFDSISGRYTPNTYVSASYDNPYHDSGASAVWSRAFHGALSQLQVGADVRRISGSDLATNFSGTGNTISATEYGSGTHAFYGIFSQAKLVSPSKRLDATLSARYDYWRNDGELTNTPYSGNKPAASGASTSNFGT